MIELMYVYDVLLFGPNQDKIDEIIKELGVRWYLVDYQRECL